MPPESLTSRGGSAPERGANRRTNLAFKHACSSSGDEEEEGEEEEAKLIWTDSSAIPGQAGSDVAEGHEQLVEQVSDHQPASVDGALEAGSGAAVMFDAFMACSPESVSACSTNRSALAPCS